MNTVNLYDMGSKRWFTQRTSSEVIDQPTPRHNFCAVMASSSPNSTTFEIIMYGGDLVFADNSK